MSDSRERLAGEESLDLSEPEGLALATRRLDDDGLLFIPAMCEPALAAQILDIARKRAYEVRSALGERDIGIGSAAGYAEIVQRSPGRWDVPITPQAFGIRDRDMPWWPIVSEVLGDDAEHSFSGVVFSDPGSGAQQWHTDSPHEAARHLPPHALNVFLALHDVPMEMGPTECARGSHRLTNHLANTALARDELIYQHAGTCPERLVEGRSEEIPERVSSPLSAGDCLMIDDRLLHRGLANRSSDKRHVAYFSYRQRGYAENTHFEAQRSLYR